jgi:hypothetical protein
MEGATGLYRHVDSPAKGETKGRYTVLEFLGAGLLSGAGVTSVSIVAFTDA